jgi:hypothetical protein
MLKIISSKNEGEIYGLATKLKPKEVGSFLDCEISEAQMHAENISIFGDINAFLIRVTREEEIEKLSEKLFKVLDDSQHFFVIVGSGAAYDKKVTEVLEDKDLKKVKLQKIEERKVFDFPTELVASLQKHYKKNSWDLLLKELAKKDPEPTHGSCVFAYKSLLVYLNDTKQNSPHSGVKDFSWKQAANNGRVGKREREEVVDKYFKLILAYHKARMGFGDLSKQLETWVLEN